MECSAWRSLVRGAAFNLGAFSILARLPLPGARSEARGAAQGDPARSHAGWRPDRSAECSGQAYVAAMKLAAQSLKLELSEFAVRAPADLEGAFAPMAVKPVGAFVTMDEPVQTYNVEPSARLVESPARRMGISRICVGWRLYWIWGQLPPDVATGGDVHGQDSQRGKTRRPTGRTGDDVPHHRECCTFIAGVP
jgi:hypothetical protein